MDNISDINQNQPHKVSEVICVKCGYRFISVRPQDTKLKELECGNCNEIGYIVETGEELEDE